MVFTISTLIMFCHFFHDSPSPQCKPLNYSLELEDDVLLLSKQELKNIKHHALPHVIVGHANRYGIVAFHVHLIGKANSKPTPAATAIIPTTAKMPNTIVPMISANFIVVPFQNVRLLSCFPYSYYNISTCQSQGKSPLSRADRCVCRPGLGGG